MGRLAFINTLTTAAVAALDNVGDTDAAAVAVAVRMVDAFSDICAGHFMYIALGAVARQRAVDSEVLALFTGNNYAELARRYGMTEYGMRRLISRAQKGKREGKAQTTRGSTSIVDLAESIEGALIKAKVPPHRLPKCVSGLVDQVRDQHGGTSQYFLIASNAFMRELDAEVLRLHRSGTNTAEIARELRIPESFLPPMLTRAQARANAGPQRGRLLAA